jgi:hypothetical protein
MELNLRKARKLESKIQTYLDTEPLQTTVPVRTLGTTKTAVSEVKSARKETLKTLDSRLELSKVRYGIRREIEKKNEECGINSLLNDKVLTEKKLQQYKSVGNTPSYTETELGDYLKANKTLLESGTVESDRWGATKAEPKTTFTVPVLSEKDLEKIESSKTDLTRRLEQIDDDLSLKNMSTKIVLTKDVTKLLESHRLL